MADIYLNADTGNDTTGDGSSGSPYETVAKANAECSTGDTIILQTATTSYSFVAATNWSLKILTIKGESTPTWQTGGTWSGARVSGAGYWYDFGVGSVIQDIIFDGISSSSINNPSLWMQDQMLIQRCIFKDSDGQDTGAYQGGLIGAVGGNGIASVSGSCTIASCIFYNTSTGSNRWFTSRNNTGNTVTYSFYNNVFDMSNITSQLFTSRAENHNVVGTNNIVYKPSSASTVAFDASIAPTDITYTWNNNCVYDSAKFTGLPSGSNNITTDPLFYDLSNYDYRLRPNSPCIGTGAVV